MANKTRVNYALIIFAIALLAIVFREPLTELVKASSDQSSEPGVSETPSTDLTVQSFYHVPDSRWLESEKMRAHEQLKGNKSDILVVPFQVRGHALDATARALMTLSLAYRIETGTSLSVADPILVAKAFGGNSRVFGEAEIARIAEVVGADQVLVGEVGHDQAGHYQLRVRLAEPKDSTELRFDKSKEFLESGISFDAERLPYFSFLERRDTIIESLVSDELTALAQSASSPDVSFPPTLTEISDSSGSSLLNAAHYLQFLGVLHPEVTSDRARDLLFERSLVLLEYIGPESETYNLLVARALLMLNRRPAALALLGENADLPTQTLQALADGNAPVATANALKIGPPMQRLIATVQGERLQLAYDRPQNTALQQGYVEIDKVWGPLIRNALIDSSPWRGTSADSLKESLDAAYPVIRLSYPAFVTRQAIAGSEPHDYALAKLILTHLDHVEKESDFPHPLGPRTSDYSDLVRNMLVADLFHRVNRTAMYLGEPQQAVGIADRFAPLFAGQPALTLAKSGAVGAHSRVSEGKEKADLHSEAFELARLGFWWTGRLTPMTARISSGSSFYFSEYSDIPIADLERLTYASDWPRPAEAAYAGTRQSRALANSQCLEVTIANFQCLRDLHNELLHSENDQPEAEKVLAENRHRFIGHPDRLNYLAEVLGETEGQASADEMHYEAIANRSPDWKSYEAIANELLRESNFEEALELVLRYPGFQGEETASRVALSNYAEGMGSQLYWAGAYEQAQILYQISAGFGTGSAAEMTSSVRLALVEGDIDTAIHFNLQRAQRYGSKFAIRDLIGLASLSGRTDSAVEIIQSVQDRFGEPELWTGALAAQRALDMSSEEISEWAFADGRPDATDDKAALSLRYIFLAQVVDRTPTKSLPDMLRRVDLREPPIQNASGVVWDNGVRRKRPDYFPSRWDPEPILGVSPEPTKLDRRLVMVAESLASIYEGDFQRAFEGLDSASDYYNLHEFLPFYAWAAAKVGKTERLDAYLTNALREKEWRREKTRAFNGELFDEYLAQTFVHGTKGEHAEAVSYLRKANADVLHNGSRHIFTRYQIMETARLLYADTKDRRYRQFALDLARRNAIIEPYQAYSHSFVAMLSNQRRERVSALARVLILDPQSRCLDTANTSELSDARKIAKAGYRHPLDDAGTAM